MDFPDSEGQALDDLSDYNGIGDVCERTEPISVDSSQYSFNKKSKVGVEIHCPTCGRAFVKKSYQQVFCTNKGVNNCKDGYHNRATESRRERAKFYNS